ncbi:hypothetical protein LRS03_23845 [Rhizobacter sp. J219]|uniref:hypothetical protein n=1 Tax=Rhizobacter sp. J219 TaxID=2898430 RepID=UPI00215129E5|nr:hypothetical protein [Rhizobacter sp. J219]MCR5885725.1 hypothetical protein [Rhizobacter sp. J219]
MASRAEILLEELYAAHAPALSRSLRPSASEVERDVAGMLVDPSAIGDAAFRRERYQRKIDVARSVKTTYEPGIGKAASTEEVSPDAYLGLALVFAEAARRAHAGFHGSARGCALRWANSAFNCLDHVRGQPETRALIPRLDEALLALCEERLR